MPHRILFTTIIGCLLSTPAYLQIKPGKAALPKPVLVPAEKIYFNSFVDCNMAEAWIGDTFRIFPGKYGEDPLWGNARDLKYADGRNAWEAFTSKKEDFREPVLPLNVAPQENGLHGAVWFETVCQDRSDGSGRTLYAVYHNENYPATHPYNPVTGKGYIDSLWPEGLTGPTTPAAVCRIGIMKSSDGGRTWNNKGIFIEDLQPRMILKPHNLSKTFAGGVGDPSAVVQGNFLYLFFGEYGYPGRYAGNTYNPVKEWKAQCISIARIALRDMDQPDGKARRWNGAGFKAASDGTGLPIASLQIPLAKGGGPASNANAGFYWGPSVSWNSYLKAWVMLMAKSEGPSWKGSSIYISFNKHPDLGKANNSQDWTSPQLLINMPDHIIWYPSLQPLNTAEDIAAKNTCLKLGKQARLFFKDQYNGKSDYYSSYIVDFKY